MATLTIITPDGAYRLDGMAVPKTVLTDLPIRLFAVAHLSYQDMVRLLGPLGLLTERVIDVTDAAQERRRPRLFRRPPRR